MYRTERVSEAGLKHLVTLYHASFGKDVSLDILKKKFDTQSFGASYIGFIAFDEITNEPAAYYGVFPITIIQNGELMLTAQSGDTMTHPSHQGKGLFTQLAKLTYDLAKENGIKLVWGFPNKNSYPGFTKKLNWVDNGNLTKFTIKVNTLPVSKLVNKINIAILTRVYKKVCNWMLSSGKEERFIKNIISKNAYVSRGIDFFEYKNYYKDRFLSGNEQNLIWAKVDSTLMVGDMVFESERSLDHFFINLKSGCFWMGIKEIVFICNKSYPYYSWFEKFPGIKIEDSLPFCHLAGWDDSLPKNFVVSLADLDTY